MPDFKPLSYASAKLGMSLEMLHAAHAEIKRLRSAVPPPFDEHRGPGVPVSPTCSEIQWLVKSAFTNELKAMTVIHDMFEVLSNGGESLVDRLLGMDREGFKGWLDQIEHNGKLSANGWKE